MSQFINNNFLCANWTAWLLISSDLLLCLCVISTVQSFHGRGDIFVAPAKTFLWSGHLNTCLIPRKYRFLFVWWCMWEVESVSPTRPPETQTVFQSRRVSTLSYSRDGKCENTPVQHSFLWGRQDEAVPHCHAKWLWQWKCGRQSAHAAAASTNPLRQQGRTLQRAVHQHEWKRSTLPGWHLHNMCWHPLALDDGPLLPLLSAILAALRTYILVRCTFIRWLRESRADMHFKRWQLHGSLPVFCGDANNYWLWLPICNGGLPLCCLHGGFPEHLGMHHWCLHHWCGHG